MIPGLAFHASYLMYDIKSEKQPGTNRPILISTRLLFSAEYHDFVIRRTRGGKERGLDYGQDTGGTEEKTS
jgi:hypothetical protein